MFAFIKFWFYYFGYEGKEKDDRLRSIWDNLLLSNGFFALAVSTWAQYNSLDSSVIVIVWVFAVLHLIIQYKIGFQYAKNGRGFFEKVVDEIDRELEEERREQEEQRKKRREKETAYDHGDAYKRKNSGKTNSSQDKQGQKSNYRHSSYGSTNYSTRSDNNYIFTRLKELELSPTIRDFTVIKQKYRQLIKIHHPDKGGSEDRTAKIIDAYKDLQKVFEGSR